MIMRGMNSASVDLIYLDPPFNSNADYAAPIGSKAAGAEFKDTWTLTDIDVEWLDLIEADHPRLYRVIHAATLKSDKSYMIYMAVRLIEMHRILKDTGSMYLHCDPTMSHYLKLMLDALFSRSSCRNEIIWCYTGPGSPGMRQFNRKHDTIFWYSKGEQWTFNRDEVRVPHKKLNEGGFGGNLKTNQELKGAVSRSDYLKRGKIPESWWAQEPGNGLCIVARIRSENMGYPTQKPVKLLERIIKASSNEGDVVFDPFCGCATTCVAAEGLGRQWVGIDISPKAADLVKLRTKDVLGTLLGDIVHRTDIPQRTDMGKLPKYNCTENKAKLYGEQSGFCNGCREHFKKVNLTVDHVIAKSKGGTDHIGNLQLLCHNCNSVKGDRGMEYLQSKLNA